MNINLNIYVNTQLFNTYNTCFNDNMGYARLHR